ncbi:bacterial transcriptional activator domain-containing protein [Amycolatopsis taiwanensis]|uniref:bacterial transcriptional activator domain-containing protein n=1 Tax=Amycolatopsis taiwanensis TaxID=342230 RepID=UPI0004B8A5FB|nr:bacterial transcriptional activator domain-containing protein [Amycolatopsis taiwanensis]
MAAQASLILAGGVLGMPAGALWALGGSVLLGGSAAVTGAVWRHRSRVATRSVPGDTVHLSRDTRLASFLSAALGQLVRGRITGGLPLPDLHTVFVAPDGIVVHFERPVPELPVLPWRVDGSADDGRSWVLHLAELGQWRPDATAFPALVTLGTSHGWSVLVDLEQAPGIIAVTGEPRQAGRLINALAFELATSPWSTQAGITMIGFDEPVCVPDQKRIQHTSSLTEALDRAERVAGRSSLVLGEADAANLATGRHHAGGRVDLRPQVLLLAEPPAPDEVDRAMRLASDAHSPVVVICLGDTSFARWNIEATADGEVALESLGLRLRPLSGVVESCQRQLRMLRRDAGYREIDIIEIPDPSRSVRAQAVPTPPPVPGHAVQPVLRPAAPPPAAVGADDGVVRAAPPPAAGRREDTVVRAAPPPAASSGDYGVVRAAPAAPVPPPAVAVGVARPARAASPSASPAPLAPNGSRSSRVPDEWRETIRALRAPVVSDAERNRLWPAPIEVRVLGPVEVLAPGPVITARKPLLTELTAAAALRDNGFTSAALRDSVRDEHELTATLRSLNAWLGADENGRPRLRETEDGWRLHDGVRVDYELFDELIAGTDPGNERARLLSALALIRGEVSHSQWLEPLSDRLSHTIVATVRRAAELADRAGDPPGVEWVLRQGLTALPFCEPLWRSLLLFQEEHNPGALRGTVEQARAALTAPDCGDCLEPETERLLARVAGGGPGLALS